METSELIKVMQAFENGLTVQYREKGRVYETWHSMNIRNRGTDWDTAHFEYRIIPSEDYRPYNNAKEFLSDWHIDYYSEKYKKSMPNIWLRKKDKFDVISQFVALSDDYVRISSHDYNYEELLYVYTFMDGYPCGVNNHDELEEEAQDG